MWWELPLPFFWAPPSHLRPRGSILSLRHIGSTLWRALAHRPAAARRRPERRSSPDTLPPCIPSPSHPDYRKRNTTHFARRTSSTRKSCHRRARTFARTHASTALQVQAPDISLDPSDQIPPPSISDGHVSENEAARLRDRILGSPSRTAPSGGRCPAARERLHLSSARDGGRLGSGPRSSENKVELTSGSLPSTLDSIALLAPDDHQEVDPNHHQDRLDTSGGATAYPPKAGSRSGLAHEQQSERATDQTTWRPQERRPRLRRRLCRRRRRTHRRPRRRGRLASRCRAGTRGREMMKEEWEQESRRRHLHLQWQPPSGRNSARPRCRLTPADRSSAPRTPLPTRCQHSHRPLHQV